MVDGLVNLMPSARIGHIGMYRDEETCKPVYYYYKMPTGKDRLVLLTNPMLLRVVVLAMLSHASKPMVTHRFVSFVSCPLHRVCRPYRNNIPM